MQSKRVSAGEGWDWFVCGWNLFVKRPGLMVVFTVLFFVLGMISGVVPILGSIIFAITMPLFLGAWYRILNELGNDEPVAIQDMFVMFGDADKRGPLMLIGVVILVSQLLSALLAVVLVGGGMAAGMSGMEGQLSGLTLGIGGLLALLGILLVGTLILMALFYAIPLVVFHEVPAMQAMKSSFSACLQNVAPLSVFGLIYFIAAMVAVLPLGLGFLALIPVSIAAAYCSYQSVYVPADTESA